MVCMSSKLHRRTANVAANQAAHETSMHPWGTGETPVRDHMVLIELGPQTAPYAGTGMPGWAYGRVQQMTPLIMPNGAPVPATAPGRWAQLYAAGRT